MFSFFSSVEGKTRTAAEQWLELADKVYHYRRDVLPEVLVGELQSHTLRLRKLLKEKGNAADLKLAIEALEGVLRRTGGRIYPKSSLVENIEFFLVAAIVVLGIRTYFVQPFKIPTNSMWPTYYGMTHELYAADEEDPAAAMKAVRLALFGARHYSLETPVAGALKVQLFGEGRLAFREKRGRKWLVFPAPVKEYQFMVGDRVVPITLPADFDFDSCVREAFSTPDRSFVELVRDEITAGHARGVEVAVRPGSKVRGAWVELGRDLKAGERFLSFDLLTGDQLFVDRVSYHFVPPSVGQGFVFRTGNIHDPALGGRDQYYIKRLVGVPGDTLAIQGTTLYRNGGPIEGAAAFEKNAKQEGRYPGYRATGLLAEGQTVEVGDDEFFALGDNSPNSLDGRYWGFVPARDAVGRPLFIYYPFSRRWGPAR